MHRAIGQNIPDYPFGQLTGPLMLLLYDPHLATPPDILSFCPVHTLPPLPSAAHLFSDDVPVSRHAMNKLLYTVQEFLSNGRQASHSLKKEKLLL